MNSKKMRPEMMFVDKIPLNKYPHLRSHILGTNLISENKSDSVIESRGTHTIPITWKNL